MQLKKLIPAKFRKNEVVIPVVRLSGVISTGGSAFKQNLSLASTAQVLAKAFAFKDAPVVAISVNSPGGSPVQSRLIYSRIRELAEEKNKKVLIFVEDVAASGGYMIALAGDEIIADETSIVGSIGVVAAGFGFDKAIEKLGIERRVYTAGKNKVGLDAFQPEKKADIDHVKKLQLDIHDIFINMVKERRGDRLVENKDTFTGMFWTGRPAKELGLIDGFGHMSTVLKERYGEKTKLKLVQPKRGFFGRTVPGVSISSEMTSAIASEFAGGILNAVEERSLWQRFGL